MKQDFAYRRNRLLRISAGKSPTAEEISDPAKDLYGNRAIANLLLKRHPEACNARLRRTAEWFDHPHPRDTKHRGESDFAAMKLCRAYCLFNDTNALTPETKNRIRRFFLTNDFFSFHGSENHALLGRTSRYLMAHAYPEDVFQAWKTRGADLIEKDGAWLDRYIRFRAERGWGEFDSACYFAPEWECMLNLHDFAPDGEIKRLAGTMLNLLLADMVVDSLNGMYCGAHGRIYARHALDHAAAKTYPLYYLYFGGVDEKTVTRGTMVDALTSDFRPHPLIEDIALDRPAAYENRERKHLHNPEDIMPRRPVQGSIRKYTYYTPRYILGCVQKQDPYPSSCRGGWYARHEQHEWDFTAAGGTRARVFTHHPGKRGNEHGYWTGDIHCCCGSFLQNRSALVALYDIPESEPYGFIHAHVRKAVFDQVIEENGFIFLRKGEVFAALKMLNGHQWAAEGEWKDIEVQSPGRRNGVVFEAGLRRDFGDFASFRKEVAANRIDFDREKPDLTYSSGRAGTLRLTADGTRELDGAPADLDYDTYDCPYLRSAWKSGLIEVQKGDEKLTLDFRREQK